MHRKALVSCLAGIFFLSLSIAGHAGGAQVLAVASTSQGRSAPPAPVAVPGTAAGKHAPTLEEVVTVRSTYQAKISPDGRWVLYTLSVWEKPKPDSHEERSHLWLVSATDPTGDGAPRQITFGEKGESSPDWSPDGKFISFVAVRPAPGENAEKPQLCLMRTDGGEAWPITDVKSGVGQYAWSKDGNRIAFIMADPLPKEEEEKQKRKDDARIFEEVQTRSHLWIFDIAAKAATQITSGKEFIVKTFSWAPSGQRIAFSAAPTAMARDERDVVYIVDLTSRALERISSATLGTESAPEWSPDGKTIAYSFRPNPFKKDPEGFTPRPILHAHLMLYDVATKQARDAYDPANFDNDFSRATWTPDGKRLVFDTSHRIYYDVFEYDITTRRYRELSHGDCTFLGNFSRDGSRVAFVRSNVTSPADVYVSDPEFKSPVRLTDINPQVRDWRLGEAEILNWKSKDGWDIEGILIKPANYEAGTRYPMLTDVHGGPTGAHAVWFDASHQFWAARGWAILLPNPRGSTGYGEKFMRGNIPDWGGGDYRDIMAGVDAAVARGIADPDKLAEMGWSYGGYMTSWIVSQTGRFKAARMGAGLSNLYGMYGTTDIPNYIASFFNGTPTAKTLALYLERSGITYADRVTTPLLIMHGEQDYRVPVSQAMEFYRALKDRGKVVELVLYPREEHGNGEWYHRLDQLRREYNWIAKHTLGESAQLPEEKKPEK